METPGSVEQEQNSGYERLEQQIKWYDTKSASAQKWYKRLKLLEIIMAASIPALAHLFPTVTAILGASIVVLEGLQHINQWGYKWTSYRSNCEVLRHEKYAYLGKFGPYAELTSEEALRLLGERTESFISTEHAKWVETQEHSLRDKNKRT